MLVEGSSIYRSLENETRIEFLSLSYPIFYPPILQAKGLQPPTSASIVHVNHASLRK